MAQIEVKFEHSLKLSKIVIPLNAPGEADLGERDVDTSNNTPIRQTLFYGIRIPLIRVNDIVLDSNDILYMELNGSGTLPTLYLDIQDTHGYIKGLQQPGNDNEVRLQILPRFDGAYKKIDMVFYIKRYEEDGNQLSLQCIYKVLDLYHSRVKCFGEISSYEFFKGIANECSLGFASNVAGSTDKRYIYCANQSYDDAIKNAIASSGESGEGIGSRILYDCWIDFWNNINFVDIYERYTSVDPDENIMIYVGDFLQDISQSSIDEESFFCTPAVLSNDPAHQDTELFISHYNTINRSTALAEGSDRVISIYNELDGEALDYMLQDGDQRKDIFTKYEYVGENPGEFNYLLSSRCRNIMRDKMLQEVLEVTVQSPLIQLMRGGKVNLKWYDIDSQLATKKQILGIKDEDISTNIQIDPQKGADEDSGPLYRINKQVSGQYYILSSIIRFENGNWSNTLRLTRPKDQKMKYLDLSEATKTI